MKVIFSHRLPFALAHGGAQTITEEIMRAVANCGAQVEPERWWDDEQKGDVLHFVARPFPDHVVFAQQKGYKVVITDLLDSVANRHPFKHFLHRLLIRTVERVAPSMTLRTGWSSYRNADAVVFPVAHESDVAQYLFGARRERCHVVPWGMRAESMKALEQPAAPGDYLISIATIDARKNTVLLARMARETNVPIVFTGKPYSESDSYFREFKNLVDDKIVRYAGFVSEEEKRRLLRSARGFVLLSRYESGCVAVYEASAAGLPLLLSDLPWARSGYPGADPIRFVSLKSPAAIATALKDFSSKAQRMTRHTFPILTWDEVGRRYMSIYENARAAQS